MPRASLLNAAVLAAVLTAATALAQRPSGTQLPNSDRSFKFLVAGNTGTDDTAQQALAGRMSELRARWRFTDVLLTGDNIRGAERPSDYMRTFETPYAALIGDGVSFHATLGDQDQREQRFYKHFNMEGRTYYTWTPPGHAIRFFMLESSYPDQTQLKWIQTELANANEQWKIAVFHHAPYSSGRSGSNLAIRRAWEPLFLQHNVTAVFSGHDRFYERVKPQHGILYFVVGSSGKVAQGGIRKGSDLTERGFDSDQAFLAVEIDGGVMSFEAISRAGQTADAGTWTPRRGAGVARD